MSKAEILSELPRLSTQDRAEIQARLEELVGDGWVDGGELSDAEKALLEGRIAEYAKHPEVGSSWGDAEARILARLRR
jgi:hypothetical protein